MNALVAPITVPPVVSNPDPPRPLLAPLQVRDPHPSGSHCWVASYSTLTLTFRRRPGALVVAVDGAGELRSYPVPGDGPLTWAEVCRVAGLVDRTQG